MTETTRFLDALLRVMPAPRRDEVKHVLIVGPGLDDPIGDLARAFPSAHVAVVERDLSAAQQLREHLCKATVRVTVIPGDASDPQQIPLKAYDLVVARHPSVARDRERWQIALGVCIDRLAPEGIIAVSTYSLPEMAFVDQVFRSNSAEVLPDSPYTLHPGPLRGDDRYLLMARKRA
jgi:hypothetical protein